MKQRQDLMRYQHELGEMRRAVDTIARAPRCAADVTERLRKVDGLIAGAASGISSALRLAMPDEAEVVR